MTISTKDAIKIITNPEQAAAFANLYYITEEELKISRHRHGRGFYYKMNDKKITDKSQIKRFKSLVIPPAWEDVKIAVLPNGHLQVTGRDEKNRKQYRYHEKWSEVRNKTKFYKMIAFGNTLPKIRAQIEKDLQLKKMSKQKCVALVLRIMEETHIRVGNKYYAKKNKTYGLSTLRTKHLTVHQDAIQFKYTGKKGKPNNVKIKSKKLRKLILQCEEIPGWELFQYYDEDGNHHTIDSGMINEYIHEISEDYFSAKDFRTWAASKIFFETLLHKGLPDSPKKIKKNIIKGYDAAARGLNNTRSVCRTHYVHPVIATSYENKSIRPYFETIAKKNKQNLLTTTEEAMLKLLKTYKINLT